MSFKITDQPINPEYQLYNILDNITPIIIPGTVTCPDGRVIVITIPSPDVIMFTSNTRQIKAANSPELRVHNDLRAGYIVCASNVPYESFIVDHITLKVISGFNFWEVYYSDILGRVVNISDECPKGDDLADVLVYQAGAIWPIRQFTIPLKIVECYHLRGIDGECLIF